MNIKDYKDGLIVEVKDNSYEFWVEEKQSVHTQEQEAIVDVLVHSRGNQYVKDDAHYYNKRYLQLGTKDN